MTGRVSLWPSRRDPFSLICGYCLDGPRHPHALVDPVCGHCLARGVGRSLDDQAALWEAFSDRDRLVRAMIDGTYAGLVPPFISQRLAIEMFWRAWVWRAVGVVVDHVADFDIWRGWFDRLGGWAGNYGHPRPDRPMRLYRGAPMETRMGPSWTEHIEVARAYAEWIHGAIASQGRRVWVLEEVAPERIIGASDHPDRPRNELVREFIVDARGLDPQEVTS